MFEMVIGITGVIGSGKSYVLSIMRDRFHCLTLEADQIAWELERPSGLCYPAILSVFGQEILGLDGQIDRQKLGRIVFSDRKKLEQLNGIVHPAVKKTIQERIERLQMQYPKQDIVLEAALLIEEHYDQICDELWFIYSEAAVRKRRLKQQRGYSEEKIAAVMENQLSDEIFRKHCDCVIWNDTSEKELIEQIESCLRRNRQ